MPNVTVWPPYGPGAEIGDGGKNTVGILSAGNCSGAPAAYACVTYLGGSFPDWFLPSIKELNEMHYKIGPGAPAPNTNIGGFACSNYWSSMEIGSEVAGYFSFISGTMHGFDKFYS